MESEDIKQVGVPIKLDKERHLIFDLNSLCDIESKYGDITKAMDIISKNPSISDIRFLLWQGLKGEDESLTEKQAGHLINIYNLTAIMNALGDAMQVSLPEVQDKAKKIMAQQKVTITKE